MDTISEWVEEINKSDKLIIVEGKKDLGALRGVGIRNRVETLDGNPLYKVAEDTAPYKYIIILTDLDKEGRKIYGRLSAYLQSHGCEIDNRFREFLLKKTKLRQIEGIKTYSERES
ncbi:toprim domain-containing protein [Candidatus Woesearchaeota archaeon]|nr:toprim domain-containing protein [Candidatus Woesearchaeota archaeon]